MADFNYEQLEQATHVVVSGGNLDSTSVLLRERAENSSKVVYKIPISSQVTMLREWADGSGSWAYIRVQETGDVGFIRNNHLLKLSNSGGFFLPKAKIEIQKMSPLALAIIPDWQESDNPYYHRENGEWWVSVTLPYTCLNNNQDLEDKKEEAKLAAIEQMYEYFGVTDQILPKIGYGPEGFKNGLLSSYVKDYYLPSRPNSKLRMLVVIPAVYLQYIKNQVDQSLSEMELQDVDENLCIKIDLETISTQQQKWLSCLAQQYNNFIVSSFKVYNFNYEKEIKKQTDGFQKLKSFLNKNDINTGIVSNQVGGDYCSPNTYRGHIKVCYDKNLNLHSVLHTDNANTDKPLLNGFSILKNSYPFNEPRFNFLFLKQNEICRTEPSIKDFFVKYVVDPRPTLIQDGRVSKTIEQKQPGIFGTQELGMALDTGAIVVALAQDLADLFGLDDTVDPNCFTSQQKDELIQKASEARNLRNIVSGDKFSDSSSVCDLIDLLGPLGAGSLNLIYDLVLRDIDFGSLWKITFPEFGDGPDGEGVPGLPDEDDPFSLGGLGSVEFGFDWPDLTKIPVSINLNTFSLMKIFGGQIYKLFLFAIGQLVLAVVIRLLKARCEMLLAAAAVGTAAAVGIAIYNSEDEEYNTDPLVLAKKNYGAQNVNDALKNSIGVFEEEPYQQHIKTIFDNCGIPSSVVSSAVTKQYLDEVSGLVSPMELLNLFDGTTTEGIINEILSFTKENYYDIYSLKNNSSKIRELFICLGENVSESVIRQIKNDVVAQLEDPDLCRNIKDELLEKMKQKCPDPLVYDSMYQKEIESDVQKFQEIIKILEDGLEESCKQSGVVYGKNGALTSAVPNLFNNDETGEKGLLSSDEYKPMSQNFAIDRMTETLFAPTKTTAQSESTNYFDTIYSTERWTKLISVFTDPLVNQLIYQQKDNSGKKYITINPQVDAQITGISVDTRPKLFNNPDGTVEMANIYVNDKLIEEGIALQSVPLTQKLEEIISQSPKAKALQESNKASKEELIFYELIRKYYKENVSSSFKLAPYFITKAEESNSEVVGLYESIIAGSAEKLAKNYGNAYSSQEIKLKVGAYYKQISDNINSIVDYQKCKDFVSNNYSLGDNEDFDNTEVLSKKQLASLLGSCHLYARSYILEYYLRTLIFMTQYDSQVKDKLATIYKGFSSQYVKELIKESITEQHYQQLLTSTSEAYEYLKTVSDTEVKEYTGETSGLDYFIDENIFDVHQKISNAIQNLGTLDVGQKLPPANVVVDLFNETWVHSYAGAVIQKDLGSYIDNNAPNSVKQEVVEGLISQYVESDGSSLFGNKYEQFKNGKFFIQKYYYVDDYSEENSKYPNFSSRKSVNSTFADFGDPKQTKYTINEKQLNNLVADNGPLVIEANKKGVNKNSTNIKDFIKGFKFGYRLCYGIAKQGTEDVDASAQAIYNVAQGYVYDNLIDNHPAATVGAISELHNRDRSMICYDGDTIELEKKAFNGQLGIGNDSYRIKNESSFSIVVPILKLDQEIDITDMKINIFIEMAKTGQFENNNLKTDLINSEEFNDFLRFCIPIDNLIYFLTFYGMQKIFWNNDKAQSAFINSKESLDRLLEIIINAKKFDYIG